MARYTVLWSCGDREQGFESFAPALELYAQHAGDRHGAQLIGEGYDGSEDGYSDGLSDAEREQVEAVDEMSVRFLEVG